MISNVSFGQVSNVAQKGQANTPQVVYNATAQEKADTYVSSKKKKSHPIAKLFVAAAAVFGGSALAAKKGALNKFVDKVANNPDAANIVDKALNGVNSLGNKVIDIASKAINKVKGINKKAAKNVTETKAREIKNVDDLKEFLRHPKNPELKKGFDNLMKKFGKDSADETIKAAKDTTKKVKISLPKDATKKAIAEDKKIEKQILIDKVKKFFKGNKNVDEVVEDASKMSKNAKKRVKARRVADEIKNWKTHNPNDVIILDDGKLGMSKYPIGLPTPEQVEATMAKMKK